MTAGPRSRFSRVPVRAAGARSLSASALRVLIALGAFVGPDGRAWPSTSTLAERAGLHRRHLPRAFAELEAAGLLTRSSQQGRLATYRINFEDTEPAPPEVQETCTDDGASDGAGTCTIPGLNLHHPRAELAPREVHKQPRTSQRTAQGGARASRRSTPSTSGMMAALKRQQSEDR